MASPIYVVEIIPIGAWDLEDVISPLGTLSASAEVWAGPNHVCSTRADPVGGLSPPWCQTLTLPVLLPPGTPVEDAVLHVHVVHAVPEDGARLLIGSATLGLCRALGDNYGYSSGGRASEWNLQLWRPCGRPQGKVHVKLVVKEMGYWAPPAACGVRPPPPSRDYTAPPPPPPPSNGQVENFGGMLTAFAAGAATGVFTGLALAKGFDNLVEKMTYVADKITDVAEKLEGLLTSDDDSEATVDDANDPYDLAYEDTSEDSSEESSEDEDNPVSEIIDLAYPDDGGSNDSGSDDGGVGGGDDNN